MSNYVLKYYSPTGTLLIPKTPFESLDYSFADNTVGTLTALIPPVYPVGLFTEDGIFEVWRTPTGKQDPLLDGETGWLINKATYKTDKNGGKAIEVLAEDAKGILSRRIVAYPTATLYAAKVGVCSDIMKAWVRENFGALAFDTTRDLSAYLTVEADSAQGAIVGDDEARQYVFDVLKTMADQSATNGLRILFDLVRTAPAHFEFRTFLNYRGQDRRSSSALSATISQARGNLTEPSLVFDWTEEHNYIYGIGKGEGDTRLEQEYGDPARYNASPFSRREYALDKSNITDATQLLNAAMGEANKDRPRYRFTGTLTETPNFLYGDAFRQGDLVTAIYQDHPLDVVINTIHVNVSQTQDNVTGSLYGEYYA